MKVRQLTETEFAQVGLVELRNMPLHSGINTPGVDITRVPGGWIYRYWDFDGERHLAPVFVPKVDCLVNGEECR